MMPVWYSSHWASTQGSFTPSTPTTVVQEEQEMEKLHAMHVSSRWTDSASQPWSNSWPRGEELPVRRACLPSRQSRWT